MADSSLASSALLGGPGGEMASKVRIPENHKDRGDIASEQCIPLVLLIMSSWAALLVMYSQFTVFDDEVLAGTESGMGLSYFFCEYY
jgi:hypothetical protein